MWHPMYATSLIMKNCTTRNKLKVCRISEAHHHDAISCGTVQLLVITGLRHYVLMLYDVVYIPNGMNLLFRTQADDQGSTVKYCSLNGTNVYKLREKEGKVLEVGRDGYSQERVFTSRGSERVLFWKLITITSKSYACGSSC